MGAVVSGHTPGPWKVTDNRSLNGAFWIEFDFSCSIAEVRHGADDGWDGKPYPGDPEANARLIVAAPDLLDALIAAESLFRHTFAEGGTIHKQMQAAIRKARGEA